MWQVKSKRGIKQEVKVTLMTRCTFKMVRQLRQEVRLLIKTAPYALPVPLEKLLKDKAS